MLLRPAPLARFSSLNPSVSLPGHRSLRRTCTESAWRRKPVTGLVPSVLTSLLGPVSGNGCDIGSGSFGTFRLGLNAHGILSSTAVQVLYQFILICSVSLTDFLCPVTCYLAGTRGSIISCMSSLLVPSGFYVSLALPFLSVVHALVLSVHTLSGPFPFTNDGATRALPPMIKQYKTCLLHVFCCFCSPFPFLFHSLLYFSGLFCSAQVFLFHRAACFGGSVSTPLVV